MSLSLRMQERFQRRSAVRFATAILYILSSAAYLVWRATTLNHSALTLSSLYYFADIIAIILGLKAIYGSMKYRHRVPPPAPPGLSVDVFIPVYKEPIDIFRQTLIAAKGIDYPHETWVLDDGRREEIRSLADEFNCHYIVREDNRFNKAGNLNHGFKHSKAEFVAVFDADFVAMPHALHSMLGFFRDEKVCMVQAPQAFYNVNNAFSFFNNKKTGAIWMDQSFFYHIAMPCQDARNACTGLGTSVVYRRSAVDEIGGFPTETVTEDMHTSLKLHKRGYETVYINEPLAYGVDAVDLAEFYKTRLRWAHGNIHVLKAENVLFCKGLSLGQRLSYLTLGLIYIEGWQQIILFSVPTISLLFGIPPFEISIFNVLVILFFPVLGYLLLQEMGCGFSRYWTNELYSLARFPVYLMAWRALFNFKMTWLISAKNMKGKFNLALISPQLTILLISATALFYGIARLARNFKTGPIADAVGTFFTGGVIPDIHVVLGDGFSLELVMVSGFFAFYNGARAAFMIRKAYRDSRKSAEEYSFDLQLPAEITLHGITETFHATAEEISISKIRFKTTSIEIGDQAQPLTAKIFLPSGPVILELRLTTPEEKKGFWDQTIDILVGLGPEEVSDKITILEADILWDGQEARDNLMQSLLSIDWQREIQNRNAYFLTPLEFFEKLFRLRKPADSTPQKWQSGLTAADSAGTRHPVFISKKNGREDEPGIQDDWHMLAFTELEVGETVEIASSNGVPPTNYRITGTLPVDILGRKGLDGAVMRKYKCQSLNMSIPRPVIS